MKKITFAVLVGILPAFAQTKTVTWYDGDTQVSATLQPDLFAEFGDFSTETAQRAAKEKFQSQATPIKVQQGFRIWKATGATLKSNLARGKLPAAAKNPSPVLRDKSGQLLALPGNVLVSFSGWKPSDAESWLQQKGLKVVRRFELLVPTFEVSAPAGLASVELANSLQGAATGVTARPNVWRDRRPR